MLEGIEDLAHAQASVLSLARARVALRPLLEQAIERTRRGAGEKEVILSLECPGELLIHADPDRLRQIVSNVLENAVKAVKSGGSVSVKASARSGEVEVAVEDDGVGITGGLRGVARRGVRVRRRCGEQVGGRGSGQGTLRV
jgi:two-component system sensor histidine kinase BaeS